MTGPTLQQQLEEAENRAAQLRQQIASGPCHLTGHSWKHLGGKNAGCDRGADCGCSVPVYVCTKCGDSDYGENAEAGDVLLACARDALD